MRTKQRLGLREQIAAHPGIAVGIAFSVGALFGALRGRRAPSVEVAKRGLGSTVIAALGALAFRALKEAALHEGSQLAKGWWADRTDRDASLDPSVEAFLEH